MQCGHATESNAVAGTRRHGNHGSRDITTDDAGERGIHTGTDDDAVHILELGKDGEKAV